MTHSPPPAPTLNFCLFLDVDGTLIDLTDTPFETTVDGDLKTLLSSVSERLGGALALVSGRSIEYLDVMFAPLRLPSAGLHGVERRKASGVMHGSSFMDAQLDAARLAIAELVLRHPGTLLEDKGRTLGVHFRLAPHAEGAVRDAVGAIVAPLEPDYHVQEGNMLLEIKPRGFTKGVALQAFMSEPPFAGRKPVFIGDDLTDLDGFRAVEKHGGLSIAVGDRVQGLHHLEGPREVRAWLQQIAALTDLRRARRKRRD